MKQYSALELLRIHKIKQERYKKQDTITKLKIQKVLKSFIGKQKQIPPMYSAKKIGGKKLYELARQGQTIEREASEIEIYDIKIILPKFRNSEIPNHLKLYCHVSSGTYIRTLAHDIGQALGCGAYLEELKRTTIGDFKLENAIVIASEAIAERSNPNNALKKISNISDAQCDDRIASVASTLPRNDILTHANWQQHLIPLKTVLVSGTFDGVHEGHKNYFQQARQYGQRLIAIVARDKVVEQIKGKLPRYSEKERVHFVKQCPEIDRVYLGVLNNIFDFTASLKPDAIALGYDQKAYTENLEQEMKKRGLKTEIIRLKPFCPDKFKSSIINGKQH